MVKKSMTVIILVLIGLFTLGQTSKEQANLQQWEYKFVFSGLEKKANELGAQGWELVAIESTGTGPGSNVPTYAYKRRKQ